MSSEPIKFYTTKGEFGFMSNFFRSQIQCFGHTWQTSEHAYQAQKFAGMNEEDYDAVHQCHNPMAAAIVGRDPNRACRPDWEKVKDDVMRFVVFHKFSQNAKISAALLATGDRPIFEYDTKRGDQHWAVDSTGKGKNMLGVILMEIREILREDALAKKEIDEMRAKCWECTGIGTYGEAKINYCMNHTGFSFTSDIYLTSLHF